MPSDPLAQHYMELAADPDIQDALRRLNELHVPDPREQEFDGAPSPIFRGLLIGVSVAVFGWAGLLWLLANWNW